MSLPTEVDASEHYAVSADDDLPTHLCVIIDTNPRAWDALSSGPSPISIHTAVANLLIFINAHLAYSNTNQLTVLAAHPNKHVFLWPPEQNLHPNPNSRLGDGDGDVVMQDAGVPAPGGAPGAAAATVAVTGAVAETTAAAASSANKLDQFAQVESTLRASLISLIASTSLGDLATSTPQVSGALMRALFRINKARVALSATAMAPTTTTTASTSTSRAEAAVGIRGRILVLSVSDSDPKQYQQIMNAAKGANNQGTPIDVLCLAGKPTLLQQAAAITEGSFIEAPVGGAHGLLAYLMHGFALESGARDSFILPSHRSVDFRGSCLCHSKFVDIGFICSNCLSVFCEPPANQVCLMCETKLALGNYGGKPALIPRRKKKRKRAPGTDGGSGAGTPSLG